MGENEIAKNLQIDSLDDIISITLKAGYNTYDKIYIDIFPILRNIYGMSTSEIPLFLFRDGLPHIRYDVTQIIIEYDNKTPKLINKVIRYDVYENNHKFDNSYTRLTFQVQRYVGNFEFKGNIIALIVDTLYDKELRIKLDSLIIDNLYQYRENGKTVIALAKNAELDSAFKYGIEFYSRNAKLINEDETPFEYTVYGINTHILSRNEHYFSFAYILF